MITLYIIINSIYTRFGAGMEVLHLPLLSPPLTRGPWQFSHLLQYLCPSLPSLTFGKEDGLELEAASVLQTTGQLTEVTAV